MNAMSCKRTQKAHCGLQLQRPTIPCTGLPTARAPCVESNSTAVFRVLYPWQPMRAPLLPSSQSGPTWPFHLSLCYVPAFVRNGGRRHACAESDKHRVSLAEPHQRLTRPHNRLPTPRPSHLLQHHRFVHSSGSGSRCDQVVELSARMIRPSSARSAHLAILPALAQRRVTASEG